MHDPWGVLRDDLPGWQVRAADLAAGTRGLCGISTRTIWLDRRLDEAERRSTLMHERIHAVRGEAACDAKTELLVEKAAARALIPVEKLTEAMMRARHVSELADELDEDLPQLLGRLASLHPAERAHLTKELGQCPTAS